MFDWPQISFVQALIHFGRWRVLLALVLLAAGGLVDGLGLLMLVPLLSLIGTPDPAEPAAGVAALLQSSGLPLTLPVILTSYIGLIAVRTGIVNCREMLLFRLQLGFVDHLRTSLHLAICQANWLHLSRGRMSDLANALTSDVSRVGYGTAVLLRLHVAAFMAVVYAVAALVLSGAATTIAIAASGGALLLLLPLVRRAGALGRAATVANQRIYSVMLDFLTGVKLAKAHGAEERHAIDFDQAVSSLRMRMVDFERGHLMARTVYQLTAAVGLAGLLWVTTTILEVSRVEVVALVVALGGYFQKLSTMHESYQEFAHAVPAFTSVCGFSEQCLAEKESAGEPSREVLSLKREITLRNVHFGYRGQSGPPVLKGVDLTIPARSTIALIGESGSGKTTIADLLVGLLEPDHGQILLDGVPLDPARRKEWRRHISYVPQEAFLFSDSIRANLAWASPASGEAEMWESLRLAAAQEFVARLGQGLDTLVGDRGSRLSGGERQRIALARALLRRPELLVLDEATNAIGVEQEALIHRAIKGLRGELTIVVIAHRISSVQHADRVVLVEAGSVAKQGFWEGNEAGVEGRSEPRPDVRFLRR